MSFFQCCIDENVCNPTNCYVGYSVVAGFEQVSENNVFTVQDEVATAPLSALAEDNDEENLKLACMTNLYNCLVHGYVQLIRIIMLADSLP